MANNVTTQVLLDGPRNAVVKFEGTLDTSDLGSTLVFDPATAAGIDNTGNLKAAKVMISKITYSIEDALVVTLFWDATTPVRVESLEGRGCMKLYPHSVLVNNAGAGVTGKITATTTGWSGVKHFSVIVEMIKTQT